VSATKVGWQLTCHITISQYTCRLCPLCKEPAKHD
jgi:hypothetical protein